MRVATIVSLGASALLGVGALVVAKTMLPAGQTGQGQVAAAPVQNLVPVVAARNDIGFGVKVTDKDLIVLKLPKDAVPQGAYSSIEQVTLLDGGSPVTLARITAREPLLPAKLSGGGVKANVAAVIGPGMRAYTIQVTDVSGGGGHVTPGDHVDVMLAMEPVGPGFKPEGATGKVIVSGAVLQNVKVLGMDMVADPANVDKFIPKTATLEVNLEDAAKLAASAEVGRLSLALRRTGAVEIEQPKPIKTLTLMGAPAPAASPVRRPAPRASAAAAPSNERSLTVVQGSDRKTVQVPADRTGVY
ncbi:Flp pilus assembly protein CpaB [Caulobacter sp. SLTY]|uniref:Flp pilus assembly protein CpaB n=1 Tax=Caulobacter sp. SLTY TaxID=2683262 RepID=UPI001412DA6D|nr:Flp pilus assembly protein CpaB [Caulobacter sp. SLTY]NBB14265.1 Flp pilus assembly protein CpaB [Caulobacter sp. SLTY]